jgi:anti-sigma factor RsiW
MRDLRRGGSRRAHARAQARLSGYLDDALPARQRSRLERHIRVCGECRRAVASVPNTLRMLRSLKIDTPPGLIDGVLSRLGEAATSTPPHSAQGDHETQSRANPQPAPRGSRTSALAARARDVLVYCLTPAYLRRSIPIAVVIGVALTAIYQLGDFVTGRADAGAYFMCACNFVVPFVLVSVGLVIARSAPRRRRP